MEGQGHRIGASSIGARISPSALARRWLRCRRSRTVLNFRERRGESTGVLFDPAEPCLSRHRWILVVVRLVARVQFDVLGCSCSA